MAGSQEMAANSSRLLAYRSASNEISRLSEPLDVKVAMHAELRKQRESQTRRLQKLLDQSESAVRKLELLEIPDSIHELQSKMEVLSRRICVLEQAERLAEQHKSI